MVNLISGPSTECKAAVSFSMGSEIRSLPEESLNLRSRAVVYKWFTSGEGVPI